MFSKHPAPQDGWIKHQLLSNKAIIFTTEYQPLVRGKKMTFDPDVELAVPEKDAPKIHTVEVFEEDGKLF